MIKSKTYTGQSGLSYIQDSELAFATIYVVKREGTQYDKFIAGSTDRKYIYAESEGKISFPTIFSPGDEKVFVLFKVGNGTEPEIPPGVCVPVAIAPKVLPSAISGDLYRHTFQLTGTGPFVLNIISLPEPMTLTLSNNTILFSGVLTIEQVETLEFSVSNCSGGSTATFLQEFEVVPETTTLYVSNLAAAPVKINSVVGIPYTLLTAGFPVASFASVNGVHGAFSGPIEVNVGGSVFPGSLSLIINSVLIQTLTTSADGAYIFSAVTCSSTDIIQISLN